MTALKIRHEKEAVKIWNSLQMAENAGLTEKKSFLHRIDQVEIAHGSVGNVDNPATHVASIDFGTAIQGFYTFGSSTRNGRDPYWL